jgi:hypothetical protein
MLGAPCASANQRCAYPATIDGCNSTPQSDAICSSSDGWHLWQPAGCDAEPTSTSCNLLGTWSLTLIPDPTPAAAHFCSPPRRTLSIAARVNGSGTLQFEDHHGQLADKGCHLTLEQDFPSANSSEDWVEIYKLSLDVRGDTMTGTFEHHTSWFCDGHEQGTVTAVRLANSGP